MNAFASAPKPAAVSAPEAWTLTDWLAHIQTQHWRSVDMNLERIAAVWEQLRGERCGWVIAVVGTNGKGSCAAMLDAALRGVGLRTGRYTSPHLVRYNERIRVDGAAADDAELCAAFAEIERARGAIPLTYFEFGTLCALRIFARRRVEVSILEAGLGGRLDAINLVGNDIALITSIGIDHAQWLGDSREAIAAEKAGVLRRGAMAVCAEPHPPRSIARIAAERDCELLQSGRDYRIESRGDGIAWCSDHAAIPSAWRRLNRLATPRALGGARQIGNLGGVVATLALSCARLPRHGNNAIEPQVALDGLANTRLA
ncbi:MAG: bifunctional folylpolyglutamate synthase/dihydrofolate synthase, partial [bacterium]